ncbi:MAG TPA: GIY-YIG nuclease family protein [Bacteroidales bacterium]|nr:GIY-YIG nuclease family protein [Bacteroidales bacterium]
MFTVYVLYSKSFDKIYIGYTSNMEARLIAHNHPKNKGWTKRYMPWELIYKETFETKAEAMKREKEMKSFRFRQFIRNEILPNLT